jgi:flavin reductase (DIM6/NTAB) family NADH-FMN oxidoreductase RutF
LQTKDYLYFLIKGDEEDMSKRKSMGIQHSMCVQPTFLIGTYDEDGNVDFAPITWVSVTCDNGDNNHFMLVISMFGSKKTKRNVIKTKQLSANLVSTNMLYLVDYFGSNSGNNGIKDKKSYDYSNGEVLHVPTLDLSKWVYECEVKKIVQTGDSDTFFCDIKNVQIDNDIDISDGIDLTLFDPVIYSGHYHYIGKHLGKIGDYLKED